MEYETSMRAYPVFLSLSGRRVLVLGAGSVGRRKIAGLLPCLPAEILALDPCAAQRALLPDAPCIRFECRSLAPDDLSGMALVFAASGDRAANARLAALADERGIWCNVADAPEEGAFQVPSLFAADDFLAAFSTGGFSPALARRIGRETGERFGPLLALLARLRPLVLARGLSGEENAAVFRAVAESELVDTLGRRDALYDRNAALLRQVLPQALHEHIAGLLAAP
jgi:precorrin-2 dehydrogenase/sirohydrochlorin ferrochelatase